MTKTEYENLEYISLYRIEAILYKEFHEIMCQHGPMIDFDSQALEYIGQNLGIDKEIYSNWTGCVVLAHEGEYIAVFVSESNIPWDLKSEYVRVL